MLSVSARYIRSAGGRLVHGVDDCRQLAACRGDGALRFVERLHGAGLYGAGCGGDSAVEGVQGVGKHFAYGRDEGAVHLGVYGACAGVGDFRCDGADFFVDVILEFRSVAGAGDGVDQVFGEGFGDDDGGVGFAGADAGHAFLLVGEVPAELVVVFQLGDDLGTEVGVSDELVGGALVVVHHGHFDAFGVVVGVPESADVEPCVHWRDENESYRHHPCGRHFQQAFEVACEYREYVAHRSPCASLVGYMLRDT
nr:MAG TPA_asm: hypothetical protein [Caudoviricetes sp.]